MPETEMEKIRKIKHIAPEILTAVSNLADVGKAINDMEDKIAFGDPALRDLRTSVAERVEKNLNQHKLNINYANGLSNKLEKEITLRTNFDSDKPEKFNGKADEVAESLLVIIEQRLGIIAQIEGAKRDASQKIFHEGGTEAQQKKTVEDFDTIKKDAIREIQDQVKVITRDHGLNPGFEAETIESMIKKIELYNEEKQARGFDKKSYDEYDANHKQLSLALKQGIEASIEGVTALSSPPVQQPNVAVRDK